MVDDSDDERRSFLFSGFFFSGVRVKRRGFSFLHCTNFSQSGFFENISFPKNDTPSPNRFTFSEKEGRGLAGFGLDFDFFSLLFV